MNPLTIPMHLQLLCALRGKELKESWRVGQTRQSEAHSRLPKPVNTMFCLICCTALPQFHCQIMPPNSTPHKLVKVGLRSLQWYQPIGGARIPIRFDIASQAYLAPFDYNIQCDRRQIARNRPTMHRRRYFSSEFYGNS